MLSFSFLDLEKEDCGPECGGKESLEKHRRFCRHPAQVS